MTSARVLHPDDREAFFRRRQRAAASLALSLGGTLLIPLPIQATTWIACFATAAALFYVRWRRHLHEALWLPPLTVFLTEATVSRAFTSPLFVLFLLYWTERKLRERKTPPRTRGLGGYGAHLRPTSGGAVDARLTPAETPGAARASRRSSRR
jgi:hypothetical protein